MTFEGLESQISTFKSYEKACVGVKAVGIARDALLRCVWLGATAAVTTHYVAVQTAEKKNRESFLTSKKIRNRCKIGNKK